jgi:predicted PurR-regulated permease PerM
MPTMVAEIKSVFSVIPTHLDRLKAGLYNWFYLHRENYYVDQFSQRFGDAWRFSASSGNWLAGSQRIVLKLISSVFHFVFSFIVIMVITFYLLLESKKLKNWFLGLLPESFRYDATVILNNINEKVALYVQAQFLICLFVAFCNILLLMVLGVNYAFVVGLIAGIATIVPIIGAVFGGTANLFFGVLNSPLTAGLALGGYMLIQFFTDHFLLPQLIGRRTEIHPLVVLLGVLIGAELLGPLGILMAVPSIITLKEIFLYLDQKEIQKT